MADKPYLTYNEYVSLGGTLSSTETFNKMLRKAQRWLDYITFNRIQALTDIPDVVKEVLVEFVDKMYDYETSTSNGGSTVTSYSNGVETFQYNPQTDDDMKKELMVLAQQWLPDYLTFRGCNFDVKEYLQSKDNDTE